MSPSRSSGPFRLAPLALFGLPLAMQIAGYWPGLITWDSIRQYDQALSGDYDDWHPPVMEWLWSKLIPIAPGPAPMLILQLVLYWGGLVGLGAWCLSRRKPLAFATLLFITLLPIPIALMGTIVKDSLMTGMLVAAAALIVWRKERDWPWLGAVALALLVFAATLRFNALPACLPLALAALPGGFLQTRLRAAASILALIVVLGAAMPVANRLLGAKKSGVELSLIIFDLGGITRFSGEDQFPPLPAIKNPVALNRHCYSPVKWDPYSWWVDEPCPIGFESVGAAFKRTGESPYARWAGAVMHHPLAYLRHRSGHFNINARFLVHDEIERPVTDQAPPNDWGFKLPGTQAQHLVDAGALATAPTPLGWPIVWMALALGVLLVAPGLSEAGLILPLAASGLLYGLSYFPTSVAAELRYHLWTMIAAGIAAALTADAMTAQRAAPHRWALFLVPALGTAILCWMAR